MAYLDTTDLSATEFYRAVILVCSRPYAAVFDYVIFGKGFQICVGGCVGFWSGFFRKFAMFQFLEAETGNVHFAQ